MDSVVVKKQNGRQVKRITRLINKQEETLLENRTDQRMLDTVRVVTTTKHTALRCQPKSVVGAPLVEK